MSQLQQIALLANYNQWINEKIYAGAATLSPEAIRRDQGAFFKSILGTLNHNIVGDIIWLQRFAVHPRRFAALALLENRERPQALDQILSEDLTKLQTWRAQLDDVIMNWAAELSDDDLQTGLHYKNMQGIAQHKLLGSLIAHFFNHQTHHRGQLTTLLMQNGVDIGVTDLLATIPDIEAV